MFDIIYVYFFIERGNNVNKYKKLAGDTLIFSIGSFSSKILSFLLVKLYTAYMIKADYSVANQLQSLVNLLGPVVTLSISESVLRYGLRKDIPKNKVYSTGVMTGVTGIATGMIVLWIIASLTRFRSYLPLMMMLLITSEFRWIQQQYVKAKNQIKLYTVDSLLSCVSLVLFSVLLIIVFRLSITGYILSIVLSDLCSILFLVYFSRSRGDFSPQNIDPKLRKSMIRYSVPLIPTTVLWWVVSSSDLFMVSKFLGDDINGLYSVAYKIPNLISFGAVIFFRAWQISAITEYGTSESREYFTKVLDAYVSLMFLGSAGIMLFLELFTKIITSEEYWESFRMAPFLVIAILMQSFCNFLSSFYNASGKNHKSLSTSAVAAGVNLALNLILIPIVKVQGAAFATMAAYLVCFAIRLVDTQRLAKYSVEWNKLGINMCLLMLMAIVILADAKFMYVWLTAAFIGVVAVNIRSVINTARKLVGR